MRTLLLPDPDSTHALGLALGACAPPGGVVALSGPLGAGKTALARGVGEGLGVPGLINSPSFILMALHEGGRQLLVHADLYRVVDAQELDEIGLPEQLAEGACVALVEWPERAPEVLPADHLRIELSYAEGGGRVARLDAQGPGAGAWLARALGARGGARP